MKKIKIYALFFIFIVLSSLSACKPEPATTKVETGKYYLVNSSDISYIEILANDKIYFHNIDFSYVDSCLAESAKNENMFFDEPVRFSDVNTATDIGDIITDLGKGEFEVKYKAVEDRDLTQLSLRFTYFKEISLIVFRNVNIYYSNRNASGSIAGEHPFVYMKN